MSKRYFGVASKKGEGEIGIKDYRDKVGVDWVNLFNEYGELRDDVEMATIEYQKRLSENIEEKRFLIREAMGVLTNRERKILYQYFWENLTLRQIADLWGISYQRVNQIINTALEKMKKTLDIDGIIIMGERIK